MLLRGPQAREAERHFGKAPGVPNSGLAAVGACLGWAPEQLMAAVREHKYGETPGFIYEKSGFEFINHLPAGKPWIFNIYVTCSFGDNYLMEGIVSRLSSSTLLGSCKLLLGNVFSWHRRLAM